MSRVSAWLCLALLAVPLILPSCARENSSGPANARADAATEAACRQRAEDASRQQDRAAIYVPSSGVNSPFSSSYVPDVTTRGLSRQFGYDTMIADCIRNAGTGAVRPAESPGTGAPGTSSQKPGSAASGTPRKAPLPIPPSPPGAR